MDKFEEAWKENRHVWESTKNLAKAMYLTGQQSRQAEIDEKDKRIEELESALKHLSESFHKSISYEHDLFDKGWNQCAEQVVKDIYRLIGIGKCERGERD